MRAALAALVVVSGIAEGDTLIPAETKELVVAISDGWDATGVTLRRYRRDGGTWKQVGDVWAGVLGYAGAAWGSGVHGVGAPNGRRGPVKREGDGRSPAGVFALSQAFGYAAEAPRGTKLGYTAALDGTWQCVDDPKSPKYNQIVDTRAVKRDWSSAEKMRRGDKQYEWSMVIDHNTQRTPKGGSCVFVHVWTGPGEPTTGCIAMAEAKMRELLATLDPSALLVVLPRAEYAALAAKWGLP